MKSGDTELYGLQLIFRSLVPSQKLIHRVSVLAFELMQQINALLIGFIEDFTNFSIEILRQGLLA